MAVTSKVVILLLFSSLAWWQASALGGFAKIIVEDLKNITTMTKALVSEVNGTSKSNVEVNGPRVIDGIKNITKAFVRANSSLDTVSGQLSKPDDVAVLAAFIQVVNTLKKLTVALVADKNFMFLKRYAGSIESALFRLREIAVTKTESYGPHLLRVLPKGKGYEMNARSFVRYLVVVLDKSLNSAHTKYT